MPNEQNLIVPSSSEARKNGSKGGKKSGEVRRRKKTMKQVMDFLLEQPANTRADYEFLVEQGIDLNSLDPDFINNMLLVNAALMARAKQGDVAAVKELRDIIRDDDMLKHKIKYDNARLRLEKQKLEPVSMPDKAYSGIPASLVAPTFSPVLFDIAEQEHSEYVFPGGRGSTKSSFCGLNVIDLLMKNENMHACVLRAVANTLKDSVYSQILWAISALGLDDEFACTKSPLEITRISTGQKIYFRGADDPHKIKSIKPPFGYIGIVWFEELDQFGGEEAVRTIEQSVIRGGERAYKFKSFNPPKSAQNWANKYIKVPRTDRLVTESTYLTVPKKWLGKPFLDDAEFLKETNPTAYENEYMGVANGTGGNVFDNVLIREITSITALTGAGIPTFTLLSECITLLLSTRCSYGRSTPATKQRMLIPQSICWSLVSRQMTLSPATVPRISLLRITEHTACLREAQRKVLTAGSIHISGCNLCGVSL